MSRAIFQIMAALSLSFAVLLLGGSVLTITHYPARSVWDLVPLATVIVMLVAAGIGLFHLRKWAALAVSLLALGVAKWQVSDALHPIPGDANWLGFVFAILLSIPSILTAVYWRTLTWHRK